MTLETSARNARGDAFYYGLLWARVTHRDTMGVPPLYS